MGWKTLTNKVGQKFPFIDYCTIEPLLQPFDALGYQAWADFLIYGLQDQKMMNEFRAAGNELTTNYETLGKFCDWLTTNYWGTRAW